MGLIYATEIFEKFFISKFSQIFKMYDYQHMHFVGSDVLRQQLFHLGTLETKQCTHYIQSSNPAEVNNFSEKLLLKRNKINKKRPGFAHF